MASRRAFNLWVTLLPLVVLGGALWSVRRHLPIFAGDTSNYDLVYPHPRVWEEKPHTPFTKFLFEHAETGAQLRGATNQITLSVNPTPDLDTEGIAAYYVETTKRNQPAWKAERLPNIKTAHLEFSAIKRTRVGKIVVTAFHVRGNTTVIMSLALDEKNLVTYDAMMGEFRKFLAEIRLVPVDAVADEA